MTGRTFNVLFLCTGNSARSIIAEAILSRDGIGRFNAYSAGSQPAGKVNPHAGTLLKGLNYDTSRFKSKSWVIFTGAHAPKMDFVFTVCDDAANESCPVWSGQPITAHWGIPDPAAVEGSQGEIAMAFADTYRMLNSRISILLNLPFASLGKLALKAELESIGKAESAPTESA